jgi:hypothetical protein
MPKQAVDKMPERARPMVFQFTYPVTPRNLRFVAGPSQSEDEILWDRQLHFIRDASAFVELYETIIDSGWTLGETILNLPKGIPPVGAAAQAAPAGAAPAGAAPVGAAAAGAAPVGAAAAGAAAAQAAPFEDAPASTDDFELSESDLIVITTRVPLDDEKETGHQRILRSHTRQESNVFSTVRQCFLEWCTRGQITLAWPIQELRHKLRLPEGNFQFSHRTAATVQRGENMAFLLFAPHLIDPEEKKPFGPKLLVSFSPAGVENWLWARALRRLHKDLLSQIISSEKYWCVIGTWDPMEAPIPPRPPTLTFANCVQPHLQVAWSKAPYEEPVVWERLLPWDKIPGATAKDGAWQVAPSR